MNSEELFTPYVGEDKYIFVSYRHTDSELVYDIITAFHNRGYRLWHDEGIPSGAQFTKHLAKKVKECEVFFCFLSPEYVEAEYCMKELHFAFQKKRRVIPIFLKEFNLPDDVEFELSTAHWACLYKSKSIDEFVDKMASNAAVFLDPCREVNTDEVKPVQLKQPEMRQLKPVQTTTEHLKPEKPGTDQTTQEQTVQNQKQQEEEAKKTEKKKRNAIIAAIVAVVLLGIVAAVLLTRPKQEELPKPDDQVTETVTEEKASAPAVETEKPAATEEPAKQTAAEAPLPTVKPEKLSESGQKALRYLSGRVEAGCPLSVYDRAGADEADNVYDNAVAALALMSDLRKHSNHSDADIRKILDSLVERVNDGSIFTQETGTRSLAAAAVALIQFDKIKPATSYIMAAQEILKQVLETCGNSAGGFNRGAGAGVRSTEDNLWLYSAFGMLSSRTATSDYAEAAENAKKYVQSMMPEGGTFFLAGDESGDLLSVRTQALAALALQDGTGIPAADALRRNGGFPPDDRSSGGISAEDTLLMALAFRAFGMEDKEAQAMAAAYGLQRENGGVPEADTADLTDGQGRTYTFAAKTSAAGWYTMAADGDNPLVP
jgi:hypothetical protein